jgi:DNA primase
MESDFQAIKEEIRARVNIVDVIGQYTRLKQAGKNWTGLCPFHADKKPSFTVSPYFHSYRCWSCGEKGDLFTFVQKKENLDFVESLEWLAKRAGIPFERKGVSPEQISERQQMLELNRLAARYFQDRLAKSREARDYLAGRALLKPTQDQWDIGYAPPDWDGLVFHLEQKRANLALAEKVGLIRARKQEGTGYYDFYRNRIIFPIHDRSGQIIGFGGRAISKDDEPKYINSADSAVFPKSKTLYGLYFALKKLEGDTPPVFVEGYVDVVTAHQAGFTQCVATLGTAMTEDHARMLVKYNRQVIICYDADRAGISATLKGAQIWESLGVEGAEVRVARLPAGDDPDSLLKRGEMSTFQAALDTAIPRVDFQIELAMQRHDLNTPEGRDAALAEAIPILATIERLSVRARYADRLVRLHPLNGRYGVERTIEQIMADAEAAAKHIQQSPRMNGYPLTEAANREPLKNEPPPADYRPPNREQWGSEWPHTREVIRKGEAQRAGQGEKSGGKDWKRGPRKTGPISDLTPPSLAAPILTGAEKAERQLLRALLSEQWRVFLLDQLRPELLVTEHGRRLLHWAARTPAGPDGGLDLRPLLDTVQEEAAGLGPWSEETGGDATAGQNSAKFSEFLRELLEDSVFTVSNERLNEVALRDCLERLRQERIKRETRELTDRMQQATQATPEEERALILQYQEKVRAMRGSRTAPGEGSVGDGAAGP